MSDERCSAEQNADIVGRLKELEDEARGVANDCDYPAELTTNWRHAETASYASALISSLRSDLAAAKEREAALVGALRALFLTPLPKGEYRVTGKVTLVDMMAMAKAEAVLDTHAPDWRTTP